MSTVQDILTTKGSNVWSTQPEATVLDAAKLMNEHKIGCLAVVDGERIVGILSERDLLQRVIVTLRDPKQTRVREAMTTDVICCRTHTTIEEARGVMKNRRIRHLPVVEDDRRLSGMISIGDLNAFAAHSNEVTIHVLEEYIHGRA